jgi:hypothetical protein
MMDIVISLLLMAVFYLGPALWKRYQAKKNPQPDIPELVLAEIINEHQETKKIPTYTVSTTELQPPAVAAKEQSIVGIVEEQSGWDGKLNHNIVTNGLIFAEILQAPRAYRPFRK